MPLELASPFWEQSITQLLQFREANALAYFIRVESRQTSPPTRKRSNSTFLNHENPHSFLRT